MVAVNNLLKLIQISSDSDRYVLSKNIYFLYTGQLSPKI